MTLGCVRAGSRTVCKGCRSAADPGSGFHSDRQPGPQTELMKRLILIAAAGIAFVASAADSILPNSALTPGDTLTSITVEQITAKGYANVLGGGARHVTDAEKRQVFVRYFGAVPAKPGYYEIDHLVPVILGGANTVSNLWPQAYAGEWGAHTKDRLEVKLMVLLRNDLKENGHEHATALLAEFQGEVKVNWTNAYAKYVGGGALKRSLNHLKSGHVE